MTDRRVVLIADASSYVGPVLARALAARDHDLVLGDPDPALVTACEALGARVTAVGGVRSLVRPEQAEALVAAAMEAHGGFHAATAATGRIVTGRFLDSTTEDLEAALLGCVRAPYHFLRAVVPPLVERRDGQVLLLTSATAARPTPGAPLYSAARAGATMLARNVADEVVRHNVQVNAVGTNFMDFPEFRRATGADDPAVRARVEAQVPLGRLGTLDELASLCLAFLDGTNRFTTCQFVTCAGGWA